MIPLLRGQLASLDEVREDRSQRLAAKAVGHAAELTADQRIARDQRLEEPVWFVSPAADEAFVDKPREKLLHRGELRAAALGIKRISQVADGGLATAPQLLEHPQLGARDRRPFTFLHQAVSCKVSFVSDVERDALSCCYGRHPVSSVKGNASRAFYRYALTGLMGGPLVSIDTTSRGKASRFSLRTLLLVTAIIALSVTVAMQYRELGPLREEVARLRREVGELTVEDPTKLHAIRVETENELEWKWRIWIPEGASYRLRSHGGPIPKEGYPTDGGTTYLRKPGEYIIRYVIRRDPRDGRWNGSLHSPRGSVGKDHQPWVEWNSRVSMTAGVGQSTQSYETGRLVEITRYRASQADSSEDIEDPAAGFMIWLEPNY